MPAVIIIFSVARVFVAKYFAYNENSAGLNQPRRRFRRNRPNPISPTPISAKLSGSGTTDALTPETNAVWSPDAVPRLSCRPSRPPNGSGHNPSR